MITYGDRGSNPRISNRLLYIYDKYSMLKGQKYHYLYKIICKVNSKYYFGIHSTKNLLDNYLGSGYYIRKSIKKYGANNHEKIILEYFDNRDSLFEAEKNIITEDILKDPLCMNISRGGLGGIQNESHAKKLNLAGNKAFKEKLKDSEFKAWFINKNKCSDTFKRLHKEGRVNYNTFEGKTHSHDTKKKIGEANAIKQSGSSNSQFGSMWITNGLENKKIKNWDFIPNNWYKGRV